MKSGAVIVTGSHGFIGRHVARAFAAKGYVVHGIGHGQWAEGEARRWGLSSFISADVTGETLARLPDASGVVHCAGGSSVAVAEADPSGDEARTVGTTSEVVRFVRSRGEMRVVLISTAAVYGNATEIPIHERTPLRPISQYGRNKLRAEELCSSPNVSSSILRMFSVYGPGLRKQLLWDACQKQARGQHEFNGTGDEVRDWLHVDDAARATLEAFSRASPGGIRVNVASGSGTSVRSVLTWLFEDLHSSGAPTFNGQQRSGDPPRYVADVSQLNRWGFQPQWPLRKGIRAYAEWFQRGAPP